jgi:hypothetical protein
MLHRWRIQRVHRWEVGPDEVLLFEKGAANIVEGDVPQERVDISSLQAFPPVENENICQCAEFFFPVTETDGWNWAGQIVELSISFPICH